MRRLRLSAALLSTWLVIGGLPATSVAATPAENDSFTDATSITGLPVSLSATTAGSSIEAGEPTGCGDVTQTVWYELKLPRQTSVEVTISADGPAHLAVYRGPDLARLKLHDCHMFTQRVGFWALAGKSYYVQVGAAGTEPLDVSVQFDAYKEPEPWPSEPDPCRSRQFTLLNPISGPNNVVWHLNAKSVPGYLKVKDVKRAIRQALKNIAGSRNDCGMPDRVSLRTRLKGVTGKRASYCRGNFDNLHVIEFKKDLPEAGRACGTSSLHEFDVWMKGQKDYYTTDPLTTHCRMGVGGRVDLETVFTHEFGHSFGLDHPEGGSGNLTMFHAVRQCNSSHRTLGRGDVLGLRRLW